MSRLPEYRCEFACRHPGCAALIRYEEAVLDGAPEAEIQRAEAHARRHGWDVGVRDVRVLCPRHRRPQE